jgi:serine/threonine protein kinase
MDIEDPPTQIDPEDSTPLPVGKLGKYVLRRRLGAGAMGEVWLGHDPHLDMPVAIKTLPRSLMEQDRAFVDRFIQEARTAVLITHKNLVRVFAVDCEDDVYYLAMEYVDGVAVSELIETGHLPVEDVLDIVAGVAQALVAAADHKVIHRDIKPDNIMRAADGTVKLCDMGLAKQTEQPDGGMTATGHVFGTPAYIAPEQAEDSKTADHRSDIYSLGATAYHLLTGVRAFEADTAMRMMLKHMQEPLAHPTEHVQDLPAPVCAMICKMMAKKPDDRYQSAADLLTDIRAIQAGEDTLLCSDFLQETVGSAERRSANSKVGLAASILVLGLALTAALVFAKYAGPEDRSVSPADADRNEQSAGDQNPTKEAVPPPLPRENRVVPDLGMSFVWIESLNLWVGQYEVTNAEFRVFRPSHASGEYGSRSLNGDRQPAVQLRYADVIEFINWLNQRETAAGRLTGKQRYWLPSPRQWRDFAQCGDGRLYPWGNTWPPTMGNYSSDIGQYRAIKGYDDGFLVSCDVEESGRNAWGLFGVGGNVWEWTDNRNPAGTKQMIHGGSWIYNQQRGMTCNAEFYYPKTHSDKLTGFRLVLTP